MNPKHTLVYHVQGVLLVPTHVTVTGDGFGEKLIWRLRSTPSASFLVATFSGVDCFVNDCGVAGGTTTSTETVSFADPTTVKVKEASPLPVTLALTQGKRIGETRINFVNSPINA